MISTRLLPAVLLAALAVSCGGSGGEGGSGDAIDLADTFASAKVCNGEANENVPDPTASNVYTYLNEGSGWSTAWFGLFGDSEAIVGDDASNILCATVTDSTEAERCEFEDDGDKFTLIMMDATYDIELRFAESANVIGRDSGSVSADPCPTITSWTPGEGERRDYPQPTELVQPFIDTFFS